MTKHLVPVLFLAAGLTAGWLAGGPSRSERSSATSGRPTKSALRPSITASKPLPTATRSRSFDAISAQMESLLEFNDRALVNEFQRLHADPESVFAGNVKDLILTTMAAEAGRRAPDPGKMAIALRDASQTNSVSLPYGYTAALETWALRDPMAACRFVIDSKIKTWGTSPFETLAHTDPGQAFSLASAIPDEFQQTHAQIDVLRIMAKTDLDGTLDSAFDLGATDKSRVYYAIDAILESVPAEQVPASIKQVEAAIADGAGVSRDIVSQAIQKLASRDPVSAANAWLNSTMRDEIDPVQFLGTWSREDGEAAITWARTHLPEEQRKHAIEECFEAWTFSDPLEVWNVINDPDSELYQAYPLEPWAAQAYAYNIGDTVGTIRAILDGESEFPVALAFRLAESSWNSELPHDLNSQLVRRFMEDPDATAIISESTKPGGKFVRSNPLSQWAEQSPVEAENLLASLPPEQAERALFAISAGMVKTAPSRAAAFLATQPDTPARNSAIQVVAAELANRNPRAAAKWVTSLPAGPTRDLAIKNVKTQGALLDPTLNDLR